MLYLATYCCGDDHRRRQIGEVVAGLSDNCWNVQDDVWVIESDDHATKLRDHIKRHLITDERVIVALLAGHAAWHGFDPDSEDWLLAHL
ncbi:MAG TPA: hypothetical protein VI168_05405 [Croceibacterium sp.]